MIIPSSRRFVSLQRKHHATITSCWDPLELTSFLWISSSRVSKNMTILVVLPKDHVHFKRTFVNFEKNVVYLLVFYEKQWVNALPMYYEHASTKAADHPNLNFQEESMSLWTSRLFLARHVYLWLYPKQNQKKQIRAELCNSQDELLLPTWNVTTNHSRRWLNILQFDRDVCVEFIWKRGINHFESYRNQMKRKKFQKWKTFFVEIKGVWEKCLSKDKSTYSGFLLSYLQSSMVVTNVENTTNFMNGCWRMRWIVAH